MLKVSIVTITRNSRVYVKDAIESVIGQTFPSIEYIMVDGGSTDGTVDIIRSYNDRISKWVSEPDGGIADAFNKGLAFTTGDYIMYLNSDDRLASPRVIEDMVAAIEREGLPELAYGDLCVIDRESGRQVRTLRWEFSAHALRFGRTIPHPSLLMHRRYFLQHGSFDTSFRIAMDYELLLRGATKSRVVHVPVTVSEFRTGGVSNPGPLVVDEIIRAQRKNGMVCTDIAATLLRAYFTGRARLRGIKSLILRVLHRRHDTSRNHTS